jgi:hypothetical protein
MSCELLEGVAAAYGEATRIDGCRLAHLLCETTSPGRSRGRRPFGGSATALETPAGLSGRPRLLPKDPGNRYLVNRGDKSAACVLAAAHSKLPDVRARSQGKRSRTGPSQFANPRIWLHQSTAAKRAVV